MYYKTIPFGTPKIFSVTTTKKKIRFFLKHEGEKYLVLAVTCFVR